MTQGINNRDRSVVDRDQPPLADIKTAPAPAEVGGRSGNGRGTDYDQSKSATLDEQAVADLVAAQLASARRRWPFLLLGLAAGAAAAYGLLTLADRDGGGDEGQASSAAPVAVIPVESRDIQEEVEWSGTLLYGDARTMSSGSGTVTAATPAGTELERGDTALRIDDQPVVVFYGREPLWRTVGSGIVGADVLTVETNLVALGYDPDTTVSVDQEFTTNTELMIERWQEDIGRAVTGRIEPADVLLLDGPAVITGQAEVGAVAGPSGTGATVTLSAQRTVTDVVSPLAGPVDAVAAVGSTVDHGTVLFELDAIPVVAVSAAQVLSDPVLSVLVGPSFTDLELEQELSAAGHDPDQEMTVDGVITDATVAALQRWQQQAGLPLTVVAEPGYHLVVPAGWTVDQHFDPPPDATAPRPVLTGSSSELRVEVEVAVADADEFAVGRSVTIELDDESSVSGSVSEIGQVTRSDPQSDPSVTVTMAVAADSNVELVEGSVTVISISSVIEDALVVATRALVSLAEGGFAVRVIDPTTSTTSTASAAPDNSGTTVGRLVAVDLGVFDDGYVQVLEGNISVGDELVVPQ